MKLKISNYQKANGFTIDNVLFNLEQNNSIAIVGPIGSGKTTIMNILGLRERCESFSVEEHNEVMHPFLSNSKKAYLEKRITTLDENPFVDFLTTNEQFQILRAVDHQKEYNEARYQALCTYFDFTKYVNYLVSDLTPKNLIKRQIILTLASNNQYIFMDEPTAGLDEKTAVKLANLINEEKESGKKFILSASTVEPVATIADYYIFLEAGKVKEEGNVPYLCKKYNVEIGDALYDSMYELKTAS